MTYDAFKGREGRRRDWNPALHVLALKKLLGRIVIIHNDTIAPGFFGLIQGFIGMLD